MIEIEVREIVTVNAREGTSPVIAVRVIEATKIAAIVTGVIEATEIEIEAIGTEIEVTETEKEVTKTEIEAIETEKGVIETKATGIEATETEIEVIETGTEAKEDAREIEATETEAKAIITGTKTVIEAKGETERRVRHRRDQREALGISLQNQSLTPNANAKPERKKLLM